MKIVENCRGDVGLSEGAANGSEVVFISYVRNEGRITVPKSLRDAYNIKEGVLVECKLKKIR